jgi:hypothetical protein
MRIFDGVWPGAPIERDSTAFLEEVLDGRTGNAPR